MEKSIFKVLFFWPILDVRRSNTTQGVLVSLHGQNRIQEDQLCYRCLRFVLEEGTEELNRHMQSKISLLKPQLLQGFMIGQASALLRNKKGWPFPRSPLNPIVPP